MQKHVKIFVVTAVNAAMKVVELGKQLNYKIKEL